MSNNNLGNSLWNLKNKIFDSDTEKNPLKDLDKFLVNDNFTTNSISNTYYQFDTLLPQYQTPNYKSYNFSTFNTADYIKNSTKNVENILKQKQITSQDIRNINNFVQNSTQNIFNDYNELATSYSTLPEILTWESAEKLKEINKHRKQSIENASNTIVMMNLAKNALKKSFGTINTEDKNYNTYLYDYIHKKERLENLGNGLMDLTSIMSDVDESRNQRAKNLMQNLGLPLPQQQTPQNFTESKVTPLQSFNDLNKKANISSYDREKEFWDAEEIYNYIQKNNKIPHAKMYNDIWWDTQFLISPLIYGKPTIEQLENLYEICGYASKLHHVHYKDRKMTIHSGLRVKNYNEYLKKNNPNVASNSSHIYGKALDFDIEGIPTDELRIKIVGTGFKGMKKSYSSWIHIDLRKSSKGYANDW